MSAQIPAGVLLDRLAAGAPAGASRPPTAAEQVAAAFTLPAAAYMVGFGALAWIGSHLAEAAWKQAFGAAANPRRRGKHEKRRRPIPPRDEDEEDET